MSEISYQVEQARQGEQLKHIENTLQEMKKMISTYMDHTMALERRLAKSEEKTDKLYWVSGLAWLTVGVVWAVGTHFKIF